MNEMHRYLLHNGAIRETSEKVLTPGQVGLLNGWGVFSTIRVFDGVLFAFERHWSRMRKDAALLRVPFPADSEPFQADLLALVEANQAINATLRVCLVRNRGGLFEGEGIERDYDVIAFTTGVNHWGDGVHLGVQANARYSACGFSGAKILSWAHNLAWLESARERGFDEVILLNEHGVVSECTSANIFAAKADRVYTPSLDCGCLPGVTRELLLGEARPEGLAVEETELRLEDLYEADSVFITSTTRELLPVLSIEGRSLKQDRVLRNQMQKSFGAYVDSYVGERLRARRQGPSAV
jgi:branched-chain amino acid aminotransferase